MGAKVVKKSLLNKHFFIKNFICGIQNVIISHFNKKYIWWFQKYTLPLQPKVY